MHETRIVDGKLELHSPETDRDRMKLPYLLCKTME